MNRNVDRGPFLERIARIKISAEYTAPKVPSPRPESIWTRFLYPASFVGVFFLSVIFAFLMRYIVYHTVGVLEAGSLSIQKWIEFGFAGGAIFFVGLLLRDRKREYSTVVIAGVLVTTFAFHNLVWEYPQVFEILFGEEWVESTEQRTLPSSLNIFGYIFEFGKA